MNGAITLIARISRTNGTLIGFLSDCMAVTMNPGLATKFKTYEAGEKIKSLSWTDSDFIYEIWCIDRTNVRQLS